MRPIEWWFVAAIALNFASDNFEHTDSNVAFGFIWLAISVFAGVKVLITAWKGKKP